MTNQERLALAALKGHIDGQVKLAKAIVRAACYRLPNEDHDYIRGFRDGNRYKAVDALREMRDAQRHLQQFCKEVGYV